MPDQSRETPRLALSDIFVEREARQRHQVALDGLIDSIKARGVITPIIVSRDAPRPFLATLRAGERRLTASRELGLTDIPVRWLEELDQIELQIIELEENIKRQDLTWQDSCRATQKIHFLYLERDAEWTITETAQAIGVSLTTVSILLRVAREMALQPALAECSTYREAYNVLARRDAREQGSALEELLAPAASEAPGVDWSATAPAKEALQTLAAPPAPAQASTPAEPKLIEGIICEDFRRWAPLYDGLKFNLLHCDLPYGTGVMSGPQAQGSEQVIYEDDPRTYFELLDAIVAALPRLISVSSHVLFWCSARITDPRSEYARETWQRLSSTPVVWWPHPLIWHKSDNSGVAAAPRHGPRHIYETCLYGSLGTRQIVKIVSDVYSSPIDRSLHPSAKPEPMLRHFFSMLVDDSTSLLDPTAGSGAALRAADSLGARRVLGLEIDEGHARVAQQAFRNARLLRRASKEAAE